LKKGKNLLTNEKNYANIIKSLSGLDDRGWLRVGVERLVRGIKNLEEST
jgi:hypothetical protein